LQTQVSQKRLDTSTKHLLTSKEDSPAALSRTVSGRAINKRADSDNCFEIIREWIQECHEMHERSCPVSESAPLPTRVIDVGAPDGSEAPRVYTTWGRPGTWVLLSHCWGRNVRFVSDSTNIHEHEKGLDLALMPPSFRDAIQVTRRLGYRYLWIDSLCVLQDSYEDWVVESSRMQEYYKNGALTIASDDTKGDEEGFLGVERTSTGNNVMVPFNSQFAAPFYKDSESPGSNTSGHPGGYVYIRSIPRYYKTVREESALSKRAWTLQEDLLSPRTIHYSADQVHWECQMHIKSESDRGVLETENRIGAGRCMKRHFLKPVQNTVIGEFDGVWYSIIGNFMKRALTVPKDKLSAIAGLAREVGHQHRYTYMAGIWLEDFHRGLIWSLDSFGERCGTYIAPTWSWASMNSLDSGNELSMPFILGFTFKRPGTSHVEYFKAELLHWHIGLETQDRYGRLVSGSITLRSRSLLISQWKTGVGIWINISNSPAGRMTYSTSTPLSRLAFHTQFKLGMMVCFFDEPLMHHEWDPEQKAFNVSSAMFNNILLLQIGTWRRVAHDPQRSDNALICFSLLLIPAGTEGSYQRIGLAELLITDSISEDIEQGWEIKDIIII
jgi:Heterokaryon incompatibility protein (HET)